MLEALNIIPLFKSSSLLPFEAAILEADLDNYLHSRDKLIRNSQIIQADDYIEVITQLVVIGKNGKSRRQTFIHPHFVHQMMAHPSFHMTPAHCADNSSKYPIHTIKPTDDSVIIHHGNNISIKILRLTHLTSSRFKLILDAIMNSNVFVHNARANESLKNKRESMRQIIKRNFTVHRYEWMLTFNQEISELLEPVFSRNAVQSIGQCHYLKNNPKDLKILHTSKAYNITAYQDGKRDCFRPGDRIKLEFTLWPTYFKQRNISIESLTMPDKIFALINADAIKWLKCYVLNKLKYSERQEFNRLTTTSNNRQVADMISNVRTLQTNIDTDRLNLENQAQQINFAINKLIAHDKRIAEMQQQIDTLFAVIESMKNDSAVTDEQDDKRKLRVVR